MRLVAVRDATQLHGQTEELVVALRFYRLPSLAAEPFADDFLVRDAFEGFGVIPLFISSIVIQTTEGRKNLGSIIYFKQFLTHIQRMRFRHQVNAPRNILHGSIRLKAHILRKPLLGILGGHAGGEFDKHMRATAHTVFHEQDFPFALLLKL